MNRLILHVGMPKAGSSSLQESLYYGLEDPRFHYLGFGLINGSRALQTLFSERSRDTFQELIGGNLRQLARTRDRWQSRLKAGLNRCRQRGKTPILSGEWCWRMTPRELTAMRKSLESEGFEPEVLVYVRPLPSWYPSGFQESIRWGEREFSPFRLWVPDETDIDESDLEAGLHRLDSVFGRTRVTVVPFEQHRLKNGCVVEDFCHRMGIDVAAGSVRRVRESLSLDATRLLYTYYSRGPGFGTGRGIIEKNVLLHRQLAALKGPGLQYHPVLLQARAEHIARQHAAVEARLGIPFGRGETAYDESLLLREEADLLRHRPESLQWLAQRTGLPVPERTEGEACTRQVVTMLDHLRRHPPLELRLARLSEFAHREWRRIWRGV